MGVGQVVFFFFSVRWLEGGEDVEGHWLWGIERGASC